MPLSCKLAHAIVAAVVLFHHATAQDWTPAYHLYNPSGWMNDPIPVFDLAAAVAGEDPYHVFFMCDPSSPIPPWSPGGQQAWCHAHSPDMMTQWTMESPALPVPAPGTGNIVPLAYVNTSRNSLPAGTGAAAFTSGARMALSSAKDILMVNWTSVTPSAVIPSPPNSSNCSMIGDVSVGTHVTAAGQLLWSMIVGSSTGNGMTTGVPTALMYLSADLKNWLYSSVLWKGDASLGPRLECPMYFLAPDGQTHVMIASPPGTGVSMWMTGSEVTNASGTFFVPHQQGTVDSGMGYASKAFQDDTGRWLLYSWIQELHPNMSRPGMQSLPREIVFNTDGSLGFRPAGEVSLSRDEHYQYTGVSVENGTYDVGAVSSPQFNLHVSASVAGIAGTNDSASFTVEVLRSADGRESTSISIQPYGSMTCDTSPMLPGQDRPGNDISGTPVSGDQANPEWCRSSCCDTAGCVAWVFVQAQPGVGTPYCWLKEAVGPTNPLSDATSGVISYAQALMTVNTTQSSLDRTATVTTYSAIISGAAPDASSGVGTTITDGGCPSTNLTATDLPGGDYTNLVVANADACLAACCGDTQCAAWTFTSDQVSDIWNCAVNTTCCWLKSSSNQVPDTNPLTTSGVVTRWNFNWDVDIYVDHSIIEVFANDGQAVITTRVYPTLADSTGARLSAQNVIADVTLDYYTMSSANIQSA